MLFYKGDKLVFTLKPKPGVKTSIDDISGLMAEAIKLGYTVFSSKGYNITHSWDRFMAPRYRAKNKPTT